MMLEKASALRSLVAEMEDLPEIQMSSFAVDVVTMTGSTFHFDHLRPLDPFSVLVAKIQKASGVPWSDFKLAIGTRILPREYSKTLNDMSISEGAALSIVQLQPKIYECPIDVQLISEDIRPEDYHLSANAVRSAARVRLDGDDSCLLIAVQNIQENGSTSEAMVLGFHFHQTFDVARGSYIMREDSNGLRADCTWHKHLQKVHRMVAHQGNQHRPPPPHLVAWELGDDVDGHQVHRLDTGWVAMDARASLKWSSIMVEGGEWFAVDLEGPVAQGNRLLGMELQVESMGKPVTGSKICARELLHLLDGRA
eukprot:gnl/TRDRNA2_/TRDRNA2_136805_c0_seq1.p1 gnl/TRDRNA2_/TRDRNA2_136805_c0~~gnl/TRDRNA2_/TRDRNA2_136805_c0_seq1.p1  ORF type:complete len:310 (-),score=45.89 gnl/TRDRNA2_/TRDRNA2_136805_c0_seq1:25-954(-)